MRHTYQFGGRQSGKTTYHLMAGGFKKLLEGATAEDVKMHGRIVLVEPRIQLVEIIVYNAGLDLAAGVRLNMEGGSTGRLCTFSPSRMRRLDV